MKTTQLQLLNKPTSDLLDDFGAGRASPGSGCAAALMGLLACRMIRTVCLKSREKEDLRANWSKFDLIMSEVETKIEPELRQLFEQDARDFEAVVSLRKNRDAEADPIQKGLLSRQANEKLEEATKCTIKIIEKCFALIDFGITIFESGWQHVRGDSGVAISASIAAVTSGIFIVSLNLKTLKSRKFAHERVALSDELFGRLQNKQQTAFRCVITLNAESVGAIQPLLFSL
jgi:methenyltetrahydrofolate cyclohydrolase